jgi:hypothetical protein
MPAVVLHGPMDCEVCGGLGCLDCLGSAPRRCPDQYCAPDPDCPGSCLECGASVIRWGR